MSKALVCYFSASGVTKNLAEKIAAAAEAPVFEIVPETLYTKHDLNWLNPLSRSSKEMRDKDSRPAIKQGAPDLSEYDTVFVGFPIWWYIAPTIVNTFLESGDFAGKKIVPFATSGGSGMGKTNKHLKDSVKGAVLVEGKVLNNATDEQIKEFVLKNM